ncbi:MAG: hypothetical protein WCE21_05415 [Candidatus Babeliales bacterium]
MKHILYACIAASITLNTHAMNQLALRATPSLATKSTQLFHKQWYTPVTSYITKRNNSSLTESNPNDFMTQWNTLRNRESTEKYNQLHRLILHTKDIAPQNLQHCASTIADDKNHHTELLRIKGIERDLNMGMVYYFSGAIVCMCGMPFLLEAPQLSETLGQAIGTGMTISLGLMAYGTVTHMDRSLDPRAREDMERYKEVSKQISTKNVKNNLNTIDAIEKLIAHKQKCNNE